MATFGQFALCQAKLKCMHEALTYSQKMENGTYS